MIFGMRYYLYEVLSHYSLLWFLLTHTRLLLALFITVLLYQPLDCKSPS